MIPRPALRPLLLLLLLGSSARSQQPAAAPLPATPAAPAAPANTLTIEGDSALRPALLRWNGLFARSHPGVTVRLKLADSSIAVGGLTARTADLALLTRSAWEVDLRPFRFVFGYPPTEVRFGRIGCLRPGGFVPPSVYVHAGNPLPGLTLAQVAQVLTAGQPAGGLSHWSQLGRAGRFAPRAIHLYGLRDDGGFATQLRAEIAHDADFADRYEALPSTADVLQAVALDPFGLAVLPALPLAALPSAVRRLPLAATPTHPFSSATCPQVRAGLYPLSPLLRFYLNRPPHRPVPPLLLDYLALVLSPEGQQALAAAGRGPAELLPLTPDEAARQLSLLRSPPP